MKRGMLLALLGIWLVGCEGVIGGAGVADGAPRGGATPGYASEASLLRLTKAQHERTVRDLLEHFLGSEATAVLGELQPVYGIIPQDSADLDVGELVGSTFSRMSQSVGDLHIRGYFDVATTLADAIVGDELRRAAVFGSCVDAPGEDHRECVGAFLDEFGLWAMRRPLSSEERAFFLDEVFGDGGRDYEATPDSLRDLLVAFLVSPNFLYFLETEGTEIADGLYELDAYELATRLSYHFWSTMPDAELFAAAADGSLLTEAGYAAQVERVYADPRTASTFEAFFYEWLALYRTGDPFGGVMSGSPQKMAFIEGMDVTPELRERMIDEVLDMTEHYRRTGSFEDLFTSRVSFAKTPDLAAIYEVPVWDGSAETLVEFPTPERQGLLGRAALLTAATVYTHPILRGVRIRQDFLCDDLGTPPAAVNGVPDEATADMTTRERIEALTSPPACSGCHQFINGLGFPLEAFDALGRYQTEEMIIDAQGSVMRAPVDVAAVPYIDGPADTASVSGPSDLVDALLASGALQTCFARHYVRFALGLSADPALGGDPETVEALAEQLQDGVPLGEVFKNIAFLPAFKQRLRGDQS